MKTLDPRKLMLRAVEVMHDSVAERRADGKAGPLVGAVLWKPDGTVQAACRGELRDGDHAEYTLLERRNRDVRLDDAVLFTTLEPCAPVARRHPKLGCAERIVLARIKRVWVGIEDPDPTVDRKGIKHLQDNGVDVHMFDRDLQERIQADNKQFIDQALERAAAARVSKRAEPTTLSPLEKASSASIKDLSSAALENYRTHARITDKVGSPAFNRRLEQQGVLQRDKRGTRPTGFGLVLFGRQPRVFLPQASMLGTLHLPDGREELRDFTGPQVLVPEAVLEWLRNRLHDPIVRSEARRRKSSDAVFELIREGVVNAIVHRDYSVQGAKCQLVVTATTVSIRSPGRPPDPLTLEQMQSFSAPMLSRNPVLHYVFAALELAEERGRGLKSMRTRAESVGLPLPAYAWEDPYLVLTIYLTSAAAVQALNPRVQSQMNPDERAAWEHISVKGGTTSSDLMEHMGFDERKAQRVLKKLQDLGLVRRLGGARATRYELARR